ncbi:UDP-N-acetylmuramate dehydrogenase [Pelistega ratti]|uniref:UDP-N-acetylmuramate dehydrogenase n=1 Tax=Pelistega ratti TaxID=2652177 RepID=UPI001356FA37|nr:UDP-N-acetylmuramate dehydrogenase [Pelistega ratti]
MYSLTALNTFGLSSYTDYFFDLTEENQLPSLLALISQHTQYFILGGGSNVVLNQHLKTLVIHNRLKGIYKEDENDDSTLIKAASGEIWHDFVGYCIQQGWYGLENLAFIPGTVGASPVQNIGAYGKEAKDYIHCVEAINLHTGNIQHFSKEDCCFAYRDSIFKQSAQHYLILSVTFKFSKKWQPMLNYADLSRYEGLNEQSSAKEIFDAVIAIRQAKLPNPKQMGNAGSFFKNPIVSAEKYQTLIHQFPQLIAYPQTDGSFKLAAGWLIDQCGWKGKSLGKVGVHDRQALVLVNYGGATADDIKTLAKTIQQDVYTKYDVHLEPEPIFVE